MPGARGSDALWARIICDPMTCWGTFITRGGQGDLGGWGGRRMSSGIDGPVSRPGSDVMAKALMYTLLVVLCR